MDGRTEETELPYGKIAGWGVAASAAVTLALLALCPLSPRQMAERVLDGDVVTIRAGAPVLSLGTPTPPDGLLAEAVERALDDAGAGRGALPRLRWMELRGETGARLREELRRELRHEMRGLRDGLREMVLEGLLPLVVEVSRGGGSLRAEMAPAEGTVHPVTATSL